MDRRKKKKNGSCPGFLLKFIFFLILAIFLTRAAVRYLPADMLFSASEKMRDVIPDWAERKLEKIGNFENKLFAEGLYGTEYEFSAEDDMKGTGFSLPSLENSDPTDLTESTAVYDRIYNQLSKHKTEFSTGSVPSTDEAGEAVLDIYQQVLADHPEIFWVTGSCSIQGYAVGATVNYTLTAETRCSMDDVEVMESKLNNMVKDIVSQIESQCSSDYSKALFAHDYLVKNCAYDTDTYYSDSQGESGSISYTAYGCLINHKALCEGYAKAYQLLMQKLGIECGYITGTASNSAGAGRHGWNYIKLDDGYYLVDVTWDDPVGASADYCSHEYFCLTTEMMGKDHIPDENQNVPECNGTTYIGGQK